MNSASIKIFVRLPVLCAIRSCFQSFMLGLLISPLFASPSMSQSIDDKLCILSSAQKLPTIQGLNIVSSSAKKIDSNEAASQLVKKSGSLERTAGDLNSVFGFMDGALSEKVKYQYTAGGPDAVRDAVQSALAKTLSGGARVELTVKAAGQEAVFSYSCGIGTLGGVYAVSTGIVR